MKFHRSILVASALASTGMISTSASATTLLGDTIKCFRNGVACSGTESAKVGAGIEFDRSTSSYNFSATGLSVDFSPTATFVTPLIYSFKDVSAPFTSFSKLSFSGLTGFNASRVTLNAGELAIDFSGVMFDSCSTLSLNLSTAAAAVPEPATWAMMLGGVGMMGFAMRRSRKAKVKAAVRFA